ncbi:MAG: VCBS repeat-containing protein [Planctomycetota bacterium]
MALCALIGCGNSHSDTTFDSEVPRAGDSAQVSEKKRSVDASLGAVELNQFVSRIEPSVRAFCGDCHAMPRPASSPKEEWLQEVDQGYMLYHDSGRKDLVMPNKADVLKYFRAQAPDEFRFDQSVQNCEELPLPLKLQTVEHESSRPPAIAHVQWMDLGLHDGPSLVYCDISTGAVIACDPSTDGNATQRLATLFQPVRVEATDLDSDGWTDLLVADIGEFNANDTDLGRAVWLRRIPDSNRFETHVLQDGLSRVADVRAADFDSDGDLDILVGVFGWRKSGRIVLLENRGAAENGSPIPKLELRELDARAGSVHVPIVDFDGDGDLDFVALISQEHERIELFRNDGSARFEPETIYAAPDPAFGSSGIRMVDIDGDGDLDILYSNGDSFDRGIKPHHGIAWLENEGSLPFKHHQIAWMPGVQTAVPGDFDGDGTMDVIAGNLIQGSQAASVQSLGVPSLAVFLQRTPGDFTPFSLQSGLARCLSIAVGDFDADGKTDIAAGRFRRGESAAQPDIDLWTSQDNEPR